MDNSQIAIPAILVAVVALFIWGRPSYDVVAILVLLATTIAGMVPAQKVFMGFGHPAVALTAVAVLMILLNFLNLGETYKAIDWPVIVLLGGMISVGGALESTGAPNLLTDGLVDLAGFLPVWLNLAFDLVLTMTLSDVMNIAATAVVMAPISVGIAQGLDSNSDGFRSAVAVGASCAFLTPIGHQCNTLVLGPGDMGFQTIDGSDRLWKC